MGTKSDWIFKRLFAVLPLVAFATPAGAATATTTANAVTLRPLSLVKIEDLEFGGIISTAAAGTVDIDPTTGARVFTGGALAGGGAPQAAQFYTYGGPLQFVQVTRGALPVLNRAGGGASMNVTQLTLNGPTLRFLNTAGLLDLRVGGRLTVGANQLGGAYEGNFQITVTYF